LNNRAGSGQVDPIAGRNFPVFYVHSPDYTYMHSGVRCLFLLCHHLNRLGYEAYITGKSAPSHLLTRHADLRLIAKNRRRGIDDIVVYPEIVGGNPLGGKKVVRYLLNKPGAFFDVKIGDYGAQDYIIHFSDEFRHEQLASHQLTIPLVDLTLFNRISEAQQRRGYLLYSMRHKPPLDKIPQWVSPYVVISQENPRDPATLARLYRQSKALVVWEPTAAISEAIHCGCPVMIIPRAGFDHWAIVRRCRGGGLVVGWHEAGLAVAQGTVGIVTGLYQARSMGLDRAIHEFVWQACRYFGSSADDVHADHGGWAISHFLRKLAAWRTFQSSRR
jgi:hypothetical protein